MSNPVAVLNSVEKGIRIPEDSPLLKAFSCLPVIGIFTQFFAELSLNEKIEGTRDPERLIELIDIKNDYKKSAIARNILSCAALLSVVALSIFSGFSAVVVLPIAGVILLLVGLAFNTYALYKNTQVKDVLQAHGYLPELVVR